MRQKLIKLTVALLSVGGFALAGPAVAAQGNSNAGNKVTICHATGSASNPYVMISPNANGVINGHVNHQDTRDIIPPFDYNDHGTANHFPGQNWNAQGQAILNNGCRVPGGGQGGGVTPPGVTPQGGNGGTVSGGQGGVVAGASTAQNQQVAAAPSGGVGAGSGGSTSLSLGALAGLVASVGSLGLGIRRLTKSEI